MNAFVIKLFSCSSHVIVTMPNYKEMIYTYICINLLSLYILHILYYIGIKMSNGAMASSQIFIWISTKCAVSQANHLRAVADMFRPWRDSSALLNIFKWTSQKRSSSNRYYTVCGDSQNIYVRAKPKCAKRWKLNSNIKQLLQTLLLLYLCIYASKRVIYTSKW